MMDVRPHPFLSPLLLSPSATADDYFSMADQPQVEFRPLLRAVELVEVISDRMATQHSGASKADPYHFAQQQ